MRYVLPLLAVVPLGLAPVPLPKPTLAQADLKAMQGDWVLTSTICDGSETNVGVNLAWRIKGNGLSHVLEGTVNPPLTITLGGSKGYRTMNMKIDGTTCLAIYRLDGDTLRVATGEPRP